MRREGKNAAEQKRFILSLKDKYPPPRIRTNTRKTFKSLIPRPKSSPRNSQTRKQIQPSVQDVSQDFQELSQEESQQEPLQQQNQPQQQQRPGFEQEFQQINRDEYDPFTMP
jgi:hypothetical protein